MSESPPRVYPYIPNSVPEVKREMLRACGAASVEELYAGIPERLRLKRPLDLPPPLLSEAELERHVQDLLNRNRAASECLSFLGAGCYQHHVPAVCDEINGRGEFLTAYAGEPYEDHGRLQALWEYTSLMAELLNMDVVNVPTYDGFQAAATALRMAARITGRGRVVLAGAIGADKLSKLRDYLKPEIEIERASYAASSGLLDFGAVEKLVSGDTAAIYFENPSYLGTIETQGEAFAALAHRHGALLVVSSEPLSLGVLAPPADYGADIVCGDIQALGMHMNFGGGHAGFIATRDEERFVMAYPSRLFGLAPTVVPGEYGFGDVAYERTSFARREEGNEWVGTAAALWGITAGVYLALLGPQGMVEIGEGIMTRARYLMQRLRQLAGVHIPFAQSHHFQEFVVTFSGRRAADVNAALLERGILSGKDLSDEFPDLGQSALYCVNETHTQADLNRLVAELEEVLQ